MNPQTYRLCVLVDQETGTKIEALMEQTRRNKSSVIREAIEKGLRQIKREQIQLETLAENGYAAITGKLQHPLQTNYEHKPTDDPRPQLITESGHFISWDDLPEQ